MIYHKGVLTGLLRITKVIRPPQFTDSGYSYRCSYRFPVKFTPPDTVIHPLQVTDSGYSHRSSYSFPPDSPPQIACPAPPKLPIRGIPVGIPIDFPQIHSSR